MNVFAIILMISTTFLLGAQEECVMDTPALCQSDLCCKMHCLGPKKFCVNAPVYPFTCNGDFEISLVGIYWKAQETGLEYAINTEAINDSTRFLVNADYKNPQFAWNFGFKLGLGYNTPCDGWDINAIWTRYYGKASSHNEAESDDNQVLLVLWSDTKEDIDPAEAFVARDIQTKWGLHLNVIDLSLGRKYWNSSRVALHPHIGLRISFLKQDFDIFHNGGILGTNPPTLPLNNEIEIDAAFKGIGIRVGSAAEWNVGCGFGIYGGFALSLNSGRYKVEHDEQNRLAEAPFSKTKILETEDSFRLTRLFTDFDFGVQYATLLYDCQYAVTILLGWEQHLFVDMNQTWRVVPQQGSAASDINNVYQQNQGDLSTQGWTVKVVLDF